MEKYTQRVVGILKEVLADIRVQEEKGWRGKGEVEVLAYTTRTTIPNLTKHDVEMMIMELECKCTHPNGMLTKCFAPETCCPDQLITFSQGGKRVSVDCQSICCHHKQHKMTEIEEIIARR